MTDQADRHVVIPPASRGSELWPQRLAKARDEHIAGGEAVLDVLLRHWHDDAGLLLGRLEAETGVAPLDTAQAWRPVFDRLAHGQARRLKGVMLADSCGQQVVALADPWDESTLRALRRLSPTSLKVFAAHEHDLRRWLDVPQEGDGQNSAVAAAGLAPSPSGPVVSFVDEAISRAVVLGASDVHFETDRAGITVKHRQDGVLQRFARMDGSANAQEVISRIKVLAQLDITERRLPQDGRFRFDSGIVGMDLRVSIMPSVHGEDAVLRLLDKAQWRQQNASRITLNALGFEEAYCQRIRDMASEPSGMLLVTGPTGSGKTTTLYAVLSEIHTGGEKTVTIEDPVEYELNDVLQIPVNERKGLTFAKGLRSILRHDPDRILIGEIRDAETAEIAVQASLTGHQVFTTVHANTVSDIMGRFRHFGLDMFGFMSSLNGVIVQRLLRRLCPSCREAQAVAPEVAAAFHSHRVPVPAQVWQARGCEACHGSGHAGRFVLAEIQVIDDEFRDLVTDGAPLSALKSHARKGEFPSLQQTGLMKVVEGVCSMEELQRVVGSFRSR